MKPKTLILMIVAVVCGLGASYMTSRLLAERDDNPAEAPVVEKVTLLVAKKNIDMHTALRAKPDDFFQPKQFSAEDAPKDALTPEDMPKLKNKFLKRGLRKGDHVSAEDLMDNKFGLQSLPNGMRAVGIRVNVEQIAGGFASLPMSHVDIIWTRRGNDTDTFSKVLLEDVVVLAADTNTHNETGGAMVASTVTVALHPDDAMKLALAMETGSLRLVLRNLEDTSSTGRDRVNVSELVRVDRGAKAKRDEAQVTGGPEPEAHVRDQDYSDRGTHEMPVIESASKAEPKTKPNRPTKITASVRNGGEVQVRYYWLDSDGELAAEPQPIVNPGPAAPAGSGTTNGSAKTEDKDGFNL